MMHYSHFSAAAWCLLVGACLAGVPTQAQAQSMAQLPASNRPAVSDNQADLLNRARLWAAKNRTDLARQLLEKLLLDDRYSPVGLASLGDLALRENKTEEAQEILNTLRWQHPKSPFTRDLELLVRVYGPEREKLAQMRLMARAGRMDEAAQMARTLLPAGPPSIGSLALEYFQIMGGVPSESARAQRQLQRLYQQTGESRYQMALLDMQLSQGTRAQALLPGLEDLADQPDVDAPALQSLWRRALARQDDNPAGVRSAQLFLQRFPDDKAIAERLASLPQPLAPPAPRKRMRARDLPIAALPEERVDPQPSSAAPQVAVTSPQAPAVAAQQRGAVLQERKAALEKRNAELIARNTALQARDAAVQALDDGNTSLAEQKLQPALLLVPQDADSLGTLGLIRLRQGQHALAQELFGEAHDLSRSEKWAQLQSTARFGGWLQQAEAALSRKDLETANAAARQALELQPENPDALNTLASVLVLQNALPEAQALYEKSLRYEADNHSSLKALARLYSRGGDSAKALALLEQAAGTDSTLAGKLAGTRVDLLKEQAETLQAQRPEAALRALESALTLEPDDAWMRHSVAQLYIRLNQPQNALAAMDAGVTLLPEAASMRYARALIRSALDDDTGALADMQHIAPTERTEGMRELVQRVSVYQQITQASTAASAQAADAPMRRAETLARDDGSLLYAVANAWFKRGKSERGVAVFARLERRAGPLPAPVQLDYASLLHRAQDDDAVARRLAYLLVQPQWNRAQQAQLMALYGNHQERLIERQRAAGNRDQALQLAFAPLPSIDSSGNAEHSEQLHSRVRAQLLAAAGEYAHASNLLQPLVTQLPDDPSLRLALGNALSRQGRHEEATVQALWLEQRLPRTDTSQQLSLLRLWQRSGQIGEARELSTRLLQTSPADTDVLLHAARLERSDRQYAQARALFERAWKQEAHNAGLAIASDDTEPESLQTVAPDAAAVASAPVVTVAVATPEPTTVATQSPSTAAHSARLMLPGSDPAAAQTGHAELDKIASDIHAIDARRQASVEGGQQTLRKNATDGVSSLRGWERPMVARIPRGYDGHYVLHVDQVHLDAGNLSLDRNEVLDYGQVAAWPASAYGAGGTRQRNSGTNLGFGFVGDSLKWDIGATGIGFPVTNVVGGISHSDRTGRFNYQIGVSRRPLTSSLMTYAGAYDPITGNVWGGVVASGASGRVSTDIGDYSTSISASYDLLTGKNVRRNTRLQMRWAADREVWKSRHSSVNVGMSLSAWRYGQDLSEYSWGHGGYYSPRNYLSLAVPVEWSGRDGPLTWLVRGAVSVSRSSSRASDFFPGNDRLQRQARNLGEQPVYFASASSGLGGSLRAVVEYDLSRQFTLGAQLEVDRSAYYAPTSVLLYARYLFAPVLGTPENRPRPVQAYSGF